LCATAPRRGTSNRCGRAQGALLQGFRALWRQFDAVIALCRSALVRDKPTERYIPACRRAQGALPQTSGRGRRKERWLSRCAARPRFKSSAIRARCAALGSIPCVPSEVVPSDAPRAFGLIPARCCGRYQAIFFGLLFFWASKRKVTRLPAGSRNARRVGGTLASRRQPETEALDPGLRRDDEQNVSAAKPSKWQAPQPQTPPPPHHPPSPPPHP